MKKAIYKAVALGNELGHIFVATSDAKGLPHLAASGKISLEENGQIGVSEWFCPGTLSNIQVNPRMSIVVWDPKTDKGFQMLGNCEKVEDMSVMDGFLPQGAHNKPLPQVERKIWVQIDKIVHFSHAPHSDLEEDIEKD